MMDPILVTTTLTLMGMATWYEPSDYSWPIVLYCGGKEKDTPWVALSVDMYEDGRVRCGDQVEVVFPNREVLRARALDAGPLYKYYIEDYPELPLIVDIPRAQWPLRYYHDLSSPVTISITVEREVFPDLHECRPGLDVRIRGPQLCP